MKLPFTRFIPHTLAFLLIASSPLSVLSTTAHANSLEQVTQQQETLNNINLQESQNELVEESQVQAPELEIVTEEQTVPIQPETAPPAVEKTPETTDVEVDTSEVTEPTTKPELPPSTPVQEPPAQEEEVDTEQPSQPQIPTTFEDRFQIAKQEMEKVKTYEEKRALVDNAIKAFQKDQKVENMQLAVDYTVLLPYNSKDEFKADKNYFGNTLASLFEFLPSNKEKEELLFHFADKSIKQTLITLNHNDLRLAEFAHSQLPEGEKKQANQTQLDIAKKKVYEKHADPGSGHIDWDDPNIEIGNPPTQEADHPNWEPGFDPDGYTPPSKPVPLPETFKEGFTVINYTSESGTCYKTLTEYAFDGTFLKRSKDVADASEKEFCTIEIPSPNAKDLYDNGWDKDLTGNVNPAPDSTTGDTGFEKEIKVDLTTDTIQYTFDKNSDSPYYYDTGIHVSKEHTLTYQQARDALHQIAVQAKGKFVEDNDRSLALLDGLIILVEDKGKPIPVSEFTSLFDETTIGVKAQSTRAGDTYELADLIEIKKISVVTINGKEVVLEANPIVDNGHVLFPLSELSKSLGGKSTIASESTTVDYKGNRIAFTDGQSSVIENGTTKKVPVHSRKNQDGILMVEVNALLDFFNSSIEVDPESNGVLIKTK